MVFRKNLKDKYALLSVYNKTNLYYLCRNLIKYNFKIISTGSTSKKIKSYGFKCIEISKLTKFKEILGGRVKTLNPKIYGSILFLRNNNEHLKDFKRLNIPEINIVIVNLYPFKKYSKLNNENKIIEMIDIGGPSLLRAASKNYKYTTPVSDISDYKKLIQNLNKNNGKTDMSFRKKMATKVFKNTSRYDKEINRWLDKSNNKKENKIKIRYGENPNQKAFLIKSKQTIFDKQFSGKSISYNNLIDVDSGYKCMKEFNEPTCVIIKHTNPCGVASSKEIYSSFKKALDCDRKSAFGGIVLLNRTVDEKLANFASEFFFEIIAATNFNKSAINILKRRKNLIILKIKNIKLQSKEYKKTSFGDLYQNANNQIINKQFLKLTSKKSTSKKLIDDLLFSLKVVKHMKSNAIVLSKNKKTIGLGSGQTNRIDALKFAINQMKKNYKLKGYVCASDGFFPFNDSIKLLHKNKCSVIAQPSGSLNDENLVEYAIKNNISLYFTKYRLFKH